ncbi:peptidase [Algiphilus sp.]|uniref:peptidase n=1 Tax=Algiphilus sp. TaxID=1872431 RepID=UPI003B522206
MTYCIAIKVDEGLVFASDTRTSAGVDDVRTYNKMHTFAFPGDRVFVLMSAGNLATTQTVLTAIKRGCETDVAGPSLRNLPTMFDVAEYIGGLSQRAQKQVAGDAPSSTTTVETTFILGGQIAGEAPQLYLIYPLGNYISASPESPFLQIGEHKYGKPILDRIIRPGVRLEDAARCALVSLDSTMRSNLSVGPPVDLALVPEGQLNISHQMRLDTDTPYYRQLKEGWEKKLEAVFAELPRFDWETGSPLGSNHPDVGAQAQSSSATVHTLGS